MPPIEKHVKKSLERTGKEYREIHEWIDEPDHKNERHDITRILEFGKMFEEKYGEEGAQEYIQHIHDDLNGKFGHLLEDMEQMVKDTLSYFGAKQT
jgi:glutaredoxin 2